LTEYVAAVELGGVRTVLAVPMIKGDALIGMITLCRQEVRAFTERQIALVENFAAQAVIAIENARLLNELRQHTTDLSERTADLTEALEQQTATSEVLQVISSSPGDLQPVFAMMLEKAVGLCEASFGTINSWDGANLSHVATSSNTPHEFIKARERTSFNPGPNDPVGRMIGAKTIVHTADLAAERDYIERLNLGESLLHLSQRWRTPVIGGPVDGDEH
jgi:hypothetical protein